MTKIHHLTQLIDKNWIILSLMFYLDGFDTIVLSREEFEKLDIIGKVVYAFREFS